MAVQRRDEVLIVQAAVGLRRFHQGVTQSHQKMFTLIGKLLGNFHLQKQRRRIELLRRTRFFMFARLQQIRAIAGAIERDFPLLAATLRANATVHRGTEAFFFTNFADRATHNCRREIMAWTCVARTLLSA